MAGDLVVYPIALIGGIEDSKAKPEPSDFVQLQNWVTFRGRFALRSPILLTTTLTTSDVNATRALAGIYHDGRLWLAVFRDALDDIRLWELTVTGAFTADRGAIWTGITGAVPRPVMASFEGGLATGGTKRIYITDFDEQQVTKFWDGTSISSLQVDFDNSGTAEDIKFHYIFPYQFHLWGAGFFQGTTGRKELLRFSQPGLIPAVDPDTGDSTEWFAADFRGVGRRGDKIMNMGLSGGPMILFKDRQTYALFGYDSQSWAVRQLSERAGAVGPYASASTGDGLCFFWSERGPHVTDGEQVIDISESVRRHVLEAEVTDQITVGFSPDDGLVYFVYPRGGSTIPDRWIVFDKERKRWSEGDGLAVGGGLIQAKHLFVVPSTTLPGPVAAPSSLVATTVDEANIGLVWVNGDVALDTQTEVYLDASNPPTTLRTTLGSGITAYTVSGLTSKTTYFARVRHIRNTQTSSYSNVPSAKTKLQRPSSFVVSSLTTGNRISLFNNETGADIEIYSRRTTWAIISGLATPPQTSFDLLTTLLAQSTGTKTFDHTTGICGQDYEYKARVTKAGETTSEYSSLDHSRACTISSITTAAHTVADSHFCQTATITWTVVIGKPEDYIRISRSIDAAAYVQRAVVPITNTYFKDGLDWKSGSTSRSLQYKLEVLNNGTEVIDTDFTTLTNQDVDGCP